MILVVVQPADAPERALYHAAVAAAVVAGSALEASVSGRLRRVR